MWQMCVVETSSTRAVLPAARKGSTHGYRVAMAQVIVYGASDSIHRNCGRLSDAIHGAVMAALAYPPEKRFRRFTALEPDDFVHPDDRGDDYTSI